MSEVKRYAHFADDNGGFVAVHDDGPYVLRADYAAVAAERDELARAVLKRPWTRLGTTDWCAGCGAMQRLVDGKRELVDHAPGCPVALAERVVKEAGDAPLGYWMRKAADEIDALRKQTGWQPMETAPKDGTPILARCDHAADEDYGDRLSVYASHAEGTRHVPDGLHVVVWGGAYEEAGDEIGYGSYVMPDWWFRAGSDFEEVANAVAWMPIPGTPEVQNDR